MINGSLASAFTGDEQEGLTKINCPGMLNLRGILWSNCKPPKCIVT